MPARRSSSLRGTVGTVGIHGRTLRIHRLATRISKLATPAPSPASALSK